MSFFDPLEDDEDDFPVADRPARGSRQRADALAWLPRVMLETALGRPGMTALKGDCSSCLVIETRSDDWVAPKERYLRQAAVFPAANLHPGQGTVMPQEAGRSAAEPREETSDKCVPVPCP